jgi:hypothetical protein
MVQEENSNNQNEVLIKFLGPRKLKLALQELAGERNVALFALLWLVLSEYARRIAPSGVKRFDEWNEVSGIPRL